MPHVCPVSLGKRLGPSQSLITVRELYSRSLRQGTLDRRLGTEHCSPVFMSTLTVCLLLTFRHRVRALLILFSLTFFFMMFQ